MSVMISLRMKGDPDRFEELVGNDPERLTRISNQAREAGCTAHAFYANAAGGELLVVDEWPDAESFKGYVEGTMHEIGPEMADVGVTEPPTPIVWRQLDTPDRI
ncbi:MAG: hypothetical protein ACLPV4_19135 [Solirubrobacteraceae bacterium]